jgi:hypothetical protein
MLRFFFDLFFDRYVVLDPGGMLFEHRAGARAAAEHMVRYLAVSRPELRNGSSWLRVRDARRNEIYRMRIDADSSTGASAAQVFPPCE